jgi:nucleotide-binding universal stress UspA family protein
VTTCRSAPPHCEDKTSVGAKGSGVEKGPADALLDVANDVDASLIIVGSQRMAGPRRLLGSVPNKVSHEAQTNVLIVSTHKP